MSHRDKKRPDKNHLVKSVQCLAVDLAETDQDLTSEQIPNNSNLLTYDVASSAMRLEIRVYVNWNGSESPRQEILTCRS